MQERLKEVSASVQSKDASCEELKAKLEAAQREKADKETELRQARCACC